MKILTTTLILSALLVATPALAAERGNRSDLLRFLPFMQDSQDNGFSQRQPVKGKDKKDTPELRTSVSTTTDKEKEPSPDRAATSTIPGIAEPGEDTPDPTPVTPIIPTPTASIGASSDPADLDRQNSTPSAATGGLYTRAHGLTVPATRMTLALGFLLAAGGLLLAERRTIEMKLGGLMALRNRVSPPQKTAAEAATAA